MTELADNISGTSIFIGARRWSADIRYMSHQGGGMLGSRRKVADMCRPIGKRVSHRASLRFVCLALFMATAPYLSGQEHSIEAGKAPASAQPAERDYRFEVASIRAVQATGFPNMEALRAADRKSVV